MEEYVVLFWALTAILLVLAIALGGVFPYLAFASAVAAAILSFRMEG